MVKRTKQPNRGAFTLIELIFAIVIISISVVSLPMMIQVNNKSMEDSMVQEAIFAASAELMGASAGYWDANSMADNAVSNLSRVIDIGSTCENNSSSPTNRLRPGHIAQPLHRRCVDDLITVVSPANTLSNTYPNLNNAEHISKPIFLNPNPQTSGYKNDYNSSLDIVQADNIKFIEINVTDTAGNLVTRLRMQSANIGEIDYYKRTF
ncbi:hypothetical protein M947_06590 [Sulfurimonas hongkongensis]|uniref:Type II secretion system protein n=1 Tax=Sulfurimonas hongkongensis TaxID=1172190 RepID=T0JS23_9BACT|nr:prepilin-type N-terminal cleavage/methylation domain-containing protein [Sulfurimonas hongkongensis]EQB39657.1 hypothetical protein M947_06590 [Sulfurimonas hongkongensis]